MPTFLTETDYTSLQRMRSELQAAFPDRDLSGVHVPYAGRHLVAQASGVPKIYVVGIATDGEYAQDVQDWPSALQYLENEWIADPTGRTHTPFWQYVSGLTKELMGRPHYECLDNLGWSNLLKVALTDAKPNLWSDQFWAIQRPYSANVLRHELANLKSTLIVILSNRGYDVIMDALEGKPVWDEGRAEVGIYHWSDLEQNNLIVWSYHPLAARFSGFFEGMLSTTIELYRKQFG